MFVLVTQASANIMTLTFDLPALAPGEKRTVVCKLHALPSNSAVSIEASN